MKRIKFFFILILLSIQNIVLAQTHSVNKSSLNINDSINFITGKVFIVDVLIAGNKKTKSYIIEREMLLHKNDSISKEDFKSLLIQSQNLIYNTTLFTSVEIIPVIKYSDNVILIVDVKEKWYIYPLPQFQLIARNFNDWLNTYNADLNRVIYGLKFSHYNLSGRRDQLHLYLLNGYSRNLSVKYSAPYSNPKLNRGFSFVAGFTSTRNINYNTNYNNKVLQYSSDKFVNNNASIGGAYAIRNGHYLTNTFGLNFQFNKIDSAIVKPDLNPNYFRDSKIEQFIPDAYYTFQYSKVDNSRYPLKGKLISAQLLKRGTSFSGGINMTQLSGSISKFIPYKNYWYSSYSLQTKIKLPFNQSYINQNAIGYGDYNLRGLEYYVVDGPISAVAKYTLKKKIISFKIPLPIHIKTIPDIPISIFAKGFADAGYSYNKPLYKTYLNNKLLYSAGFGIDILTVYDINLRMEYSFNQLNENGLFLHSNGGF